MSVVHPCCDNNGHAASHLQQHALAASAPPLHQVPEPIPQRLVSQYVPYLPVIPYTSAHVPSSLPAYGAPCLHDGTTVSTAGPASFTIGDSLYSQQRLPG